MTDDRQWQSPEGPPPGDQSSIDSTPPKSGTPAGPGYRVIPTPASPAAYSPPPGYPGAGYPQNNSGWTPPPRPGLIPLRPLDLGTILGSSFRVLRRNPRPTFGAALLLNGTAYVLLLSVVAFVTFNAVSRITSSTRENADQIAAGSSGLIILSAVIPGLLVVVASAMLQGIIVLEVSRGTVGEKLTFRALWQQARGRFGALIGWSALLIIAFVVVLILFVAIIVLIAILLGGTGAVVFSILFGVFGGIGLIVVLVWLSTKLSLVPSIIMVERLGIGRSMARSWKLTRGFFWRTFGILALVAVMLGIISQVTSAPLGLLSPLLTQLIDPQGQNGPTVGIVAVTVAIIGVIIAVAVQSITAVVQASATALVYIDLRIRQEGLGLELAHFVEARQAGDATVIDPLLHHAASTVEHQTGVMPPLDRSPWQ